MKNIIVVGYPKSGNTWVTRLVAELVSCPVAGFWNEPDNKEIALEGHERGSEYRCYKAHQGLHELHIDEKSDHYHIIYVVRDPRDLAVSGANYFKFHRSKKFRSIIRKIPGGKKIYKEWIYPLISPEPYRIEQMITYLLDGGVGWLSTPWSKHYRPYLDKKVLFVRYEDMLVSPQNEAKRILNYLNIDKDNDFIENAVKKQSFENKKKEFSGRGENKKASFLRVGKSRQWEEKLSKDQIDKMNKHLEIDLKRLHYDL